MKHIYPTFLESTRDYKLLQEFWKTKIWEVVPAYARVGWVAPWLDVLEPELEQGNPIFSAWAPGLKRGLQVIQIPPGRFRGEIAKWIDWSGGDSADPDAIEKLVVKCVLTDLNVPEILETFADWAENGQVTDRLEYFDVMTPNNYSPQELRAESR